MEEREFIESWNLYIYRNRRKGNYREELLRMGQNILVRSGIRAKEWS